MREEEAEKLIDAVRERCSGQSFVEQAPAIWAQDLAAHGITYEMAEWIVRHIAQRRSFVEADYKRITLGDIIGHYLKVRRDRLNKAGPLPPSPDPDNVQAYLKHHRSTISLIASGRGDASAMDLTGAVGASERRVQALRQASGQAPQPQPRPARDTNITQALQQARNQCREASQNLHQGHRQPDRLPQPPTPRPTRPATNHTNPTQDTTRAGDALRALFGPQTPDWIDQATQNQNGWCGRCHQDTRTKIITNPNGTQAAVDCCTPNRTPKPTTMATDSTSTTRASRVSAS